MRLIDCFVLLMAYVSLLLRRDPVGQADYETVRNDVRRLIGHSENCMSKGGMDHADYDMARFAVFAWIDEAVMNSDWEGRRMWQKALLQRQYYETVEAGEVFFDRLNRIGLHQRDIREVYYVCLAMGFTGQYRNEGDSVLLEGLKNENLKILTGSALGVSSLSNREMFPEAYAQEAVQTPPDLAKKRFSPVTVMFLAAPVILYAALYIVYRFVLSNIGQSFIQTVS